MQPVTTGRHHPAGVKHVELRERPGGGSECDHPVKVMTA
jgi:hypothetical protein